MAIATLFRLAKLREKLLAAIKNQRIRFSLGVAFLRSCSQLDQLLRLRAALAAGGDTKSTRCVSRAAGQLPSESSRRRA